MRNITMFAVLFLVGGLHPFAPATQAALPGAGPDSAIAPAALESPRTPALPAEHIGDAAAMIPLTEDEAQPDSVPAAVKPRLLPDKISFMERAIWGENGFFRNTGIASPLTPAVRRHELGVRRTMLTMHQIGGFVTLCSMVATVYYGQKYLDSGLRSDRNMHQTFIPITIGCYAATGLLAVFSPPPMIRRDETSTTTIHKALAWVHAAGMILTPILGAAINKRGAPNADRARFHQVAAYITTSVFVASMIVITF